MTEKDLKSRGTKVHMKSGSENRKPIRDGYTKI